MSYYVIPCTPIGPRELKSWVLSIGHISRSCCYVLPVELLNKELKRHYSEWSERDFQDLHPDLSATLPPYLTLDFVNFELYSSKQRRDLKRAWLTHKNTHEIDTNLFSTRYKNSECHSTFKYYVL